MSLTLIFRVFFIPAKADAQEISPDKIIRDQYIQQPICTPTLDKFGSSTCSYETYSEVIRFEYEDKEILPEEIDGFREIYSLREPNKQIFENGKTRKIKLYFNDRFSPDNVLYELNTSEMSREEFDNLYTQELSISKDYFNLTAYAETATTTGTLNEETTLYSYSGMDTTNYCTETVDHHGSYATNNLTTELWQITIPSDPGGTLTDVDLYIYKVSGSVDRVTEYHEVLRKDTNLCEATWNVYKSGSNWSTPGAKGIGTDISATAFDYGNVGFLNNNWYIIGLMGDNASSSLPLEWGSSTIIMGYTPTTGNDSSQYSFDTSEYTTDITKRPYIIITYELDEEPPEEPTSTSTPYDGITGMQYSDDLSIITSYKEHYETSSITPDWIEYEYYHIPFFVYIVIAVPTIWIGSRLILELIIRLRK